MQNFPKNPIVLIDGSSYLYRAFHAFPPLTNTKGEPTGAMYGVLNMIRSLNHKIRPSHIAIVFDAKGKTFRDEIFADYKAHRPAMPDALKQQIEPLHKILQAQGYPILIVENVEADDVIGTLALKFAKQNKHTLISTSDKDMAQLVNDHITLINTMNNTILDKEGVIEKFGIPPKFIIDYLALMGDASDNIPGIPGIGEKTAKAIIQEIGGIADIYNNLDKIIFLNIRGAKTLADKLMNSKELAELSYKLATIKIDVPIDTNIDNFIMQDANINELINYYQRYDFKKWLAELNTSNNDEVQSVNVNQDLTLNAHTTASSTTTLIDYQSYKTILTDNDFNLLINRLNNSKYFAFDTETDSLNYMQANLVGISFAFENFDAFYIPLSHNYLGVPNQLDLITTLNALKPIFANENIGKIGQNIKYDINILHKYDIAVKNILADTMLQSYVLNSLDKHNMDDLSSKYLAHKTILFSDITGKGKNRLTFDQIDLDAATKYAAEDADVTMRLYQCLVNSLNQQTDLLNVYNKIELPLIAILSAMELQGVLLDKNLLSLLSIKFNQDLLQLEKQIFLLAGRPFNISSPKQLQEILFTELQLPIIKKTASGIPSTNEEVLIELSSDYELPKLILKYRNLSKLKSTYTDKLPQMVDIKTARIHTSYNQAVTSTGRLSSSDPNLQNIPIKNEEGREIRKAFIAKQGYKIIAADYSQIELRIMAHLSNDDGMLQAFANNLDIHKATAAEIFQTEISSITSEQRRSAKAINFGLIYGMSAFGLAKQLHISRKQAQAYIDMYFSRYPAVLEYMEHIKQIATKQGYVETIFKRRLYLPEINTSNAIVRKGAERLAINAPMQGTAADIIKLSMIELYNHTIKNNPEISMLMQVHDELVFEVIADKIDLYIPIIKQKMEQIVTLNVPLIVDVGIGNNWDEAH